MTKVLLVYKKSEYEIREAHLDDPDTKRYLERTGRRKQDLIVLDRLHNECLDSVIDFLGKHANTDVLYRAEVSERVNDYELIVCVGGDGTVLNAAKHDISVPLIGINSTTHDIPGVYPGSKGYFCGLDRMMDLDERFNALLTGEIPITMLNRLEAELNGKNIDQLVLNEVLVAHQNPAAASYYRVVVGDIIDDQGSSGLMIATPQQTWAIKSGGEILPIDKRVCQLFARERFKGNYDTIVVDDKEVVIESDTRQGMLYIDGSHEECMHPFTYGSILRVRYSNKPLPLIGFDNERRLREFAVKLPPVVAYA